MTSSNYLTKIAVVGVGGNSRLISEALLKTSKHTITALTRIDSVNKSPEGVVSKLVDYNKPATLVQALRGQDALVISLSSHAPRETEALLISVAGEAGVEWILPVEALVKDFPMFQSKVTTRKAITELGKSSYIAVATGYWYEWSLTVPAGFGIDFANRTVTFFDEGEARISTSTLTQVGHAVAALLSLPIKPEAGINLIGLLGKGTISVLTQLGWM